MPDQGIGEQIACWIEPGSDLCHEYQVARQQYELSNIQQQQVLARAQEQAAAAQLRATTQALVPLAFLFGVVALAVGGVGYYVWNKNQKRKSPLGEYTDAELEQMISEQVSR